MRQLHERSAVVDSNQPKLIARSRPAAYSAGVPLSVAVQERAVELLDIDAAILHGLEGVGVLHQPARGFLRVVLNFIVSTGATTARV